MLEIFNKLIDCLGVVKVVGGIEGSKHGKKQAIEILEHCKELIDRLIEDMGRGLDE